MKNAIREGTKFVSYEASQPLALITDGAVADSVRRTITNTLTKPFPPLLDQEGGGSTSFASSNDSFADGRRSLANSDEESDDEDDHFFNELDSISILSHSRSPSPSPPPTLSVYCERPLQRRMEHAAAEAEADRMDRALQRLPPPPTWPPVHTHDTPMHLSQVYTKESFAASPPSTRAQSVALGRGGEVITTVTSTTDQMERNWRRIAATSPPFSSSALSPPTPHRASVDSATEKDFQRLLGEEGMETV